MSLLKNFLIAPSVDADLGSLRSIIFSNAHCCCTIELYMWEQLSKFLGPSCMICIHASAHHIRRLNVPLPYDAGIAFVQPASAGSLRRHVSTSLMQHHRLVERNRHAIQPLSPASYGSSMEVCKFLEGFWSPLYPNSCLCFCLIVSVTSLSTRYMTANHLFLHVFVYGR